MKETMKKVAMVIMGMVIGVLIIIGINALTETEKLPSEETILTTYLKEVKDVDAHTVEYTYEPDEYHDEDYVDYIAYDNNGKTVFFGGIDLSYAYHTYTK